jgi:Domain of unknown function (DUF397)
MSLSDLEVSNLQWRKARRSVNNGACVEVAPEDGQILVRDSTDRDGFIIRYSGYSWHAFVADVKTGRFNAGRI